MTREETIERLKELGIEDPVDEMGRLVLSGADLSGADLSGVNLFGANLSGADLSGVDLFGAILTDAQLFGTNLCNADFVGTGRSWGHLSGAHYDAVTVWPPGFDPAAHGAIRVD